MSSPGFLSLPREIRDAIYEYLVVKPTNTITMLESHDCFANEISAAQPAISRVNKQVRAESLPMFYKRNLFVAELGDSLDLATATRWLHAIGDLHAGHLRRLALRGWAGIVFGHGKLRLPIRAALNLQDGSLEVEGNETALGEDRYVVKDVQALRDCWAAIVQRRIASGEPFDVASICSLMEGFYGLCTA